MIIEIGPPPSHRFWAGVEFDVDVIDSRDVPPRPGPAGPFQPECRDSAVKLLEIDVAGKALDPSHVVSRATGLESAGVLG